MEMYQLVIIILIIIGIVGIILLGGGIAIGSLLGGKMTEAYYHVRGIPQSVRQHERLTRIILSIIMSVGCLVLIVFCFFFSDFLAGAQSRYLSIIGSPIPQSVSILHAKKTLNIFRQTTFVHFTIAPEDMQRILPNSTLPVPIPGTTGCHTSKLPAWWQPEQFGDGIQTYLKKGWFESVAYYVNNSFTEVYACEYDED